MCIHCSGPHSADQAQWELPALSTSENQHAYFRAKPWMWSQMPGMKSEGVAMMYCLASSIYYKNMHPNASHEKYLKLLLPQMLLLTL